MYVILYTLSTNTKNESHDCTVEGASFCIFHPTNEIKKE